MMHVKDVTSMVNWTNLTLSVNSGVLNIFCSIERFIYLTNRESNFSQSKHIGAYLWLKLFLLLFPAQLEKKVREMHALLTKLEEEKYDWEVKIRRQDYEV